MIPQGLLLPQPKATWNSSGRTKQEQKKAAPSVNSTEEPPCSQWRASPPSLLHLRTYNSEVGAGSNACDDVGGDAFPLAVVILAEGADLQGATGQCVVLAPAGLPYLGQGAGQREKETGLSSGLRRRARRQRGHTKLPAWPRGHRRPPARELVSPVAAGQPVPRLARGPGGATREEGVREVGARRPHGHRSRS